MYFCIFLESYLVEINIKLEVLSRLKGNSAERRKLVGCRMLHYFRDQVLKQIIKLCVKLLTW